VTVISAVGDDRVDGVRPAVMAFREVFAITFTFLAGV
jgi:hypothetical protein